MAHNKINTSTRRNREEGTNADLSIGAAIGLAGAAACAAMAGAEVGHRGGSYLCDRVSRWWNDDGKENRGNDNPSGKH